MRGVDNPSGELKMFKNNRVLKEITYAVKMKCEAVRWFEREKGGNHNYKQ